MRELWKYLLTNLVVFGLVFFGVILFFFSRYGGYGMMGGWGYMPIMGGFGIMGGLMMLFVFLLGLAVIGLIVYGVVVLLRRPTQMITPPQNLTNNCPSCGKPTQADWKTCPYCGNSL